MAQDVKPGIRLAAGFPLCPARRRASGPAAPKWPCRLPCRNGSTYPWHIPAQAPPEGISFLNRRSGIEQGRGRTYSANPLQEKPHGTRCGLHQPDHHSRAQRGLVHPAAHSFAARKVTAAGRTPSVRSGVSGPFGATRPGPGHREDVPGRAQRVGVTEPTGISRVAPTAKRPSPVRCPAWP